ncbi:MAG TPA: acyl-CoA carboxylase subunit beta [Conexibacter sp.]|jgi:acetyl-CoA carboxylase carboxyltransferase component|nr:acyl-CoA carboxylase subunit beta [Conexibacter sp.]
MSVTAARTESTQAAAPAASERLSPHERLEMLCDAGTFEPIRSGVISPKLGARARAGDGVVGGLGRVDGRPVACYAQDVSFLGGSLGAAHADTINRVLQLAGRSRVPVVGFIESGGARMQEGTAALGGYGRIFRHNVALSGVVPQISIIGGLSAGGGCYSPALTDFVVMTQDAAMFLTGPSVVKDVMGEDVSAADLGGSKVHDRNGVCDLVVEDDRAAAALSRSLLSYLPQHSGAGLPRTLAREPQLADPGAAVPDDPRKVYDVRDAIAGIVDAGSLLEIQPRWARSIVTGFARIDGRPVGVIANQPRFLGGVLDAESSQKGARFVETCDAYGVPLVVLVDTPGFMPGTRQEQAGVIRFGATLVRAFAAATVPRVTVVLRKAYGGAYITMNSKDLGADMVFAWPNAALGVMGAQPAVGIIHRRELAAAADPVAAREELAAAYTEEHLGADVAAAAGFVDEVIEPSTTRRRLSWAFSTMDDRRAGAFLA